MNKTDKLRHFYKDRNVYITGITGFKGAWLAMMLHELGAKVYGIGLPIEGESLGEKIGLDDQVFVAYGDITAPANDSRYIETMAYACPDVVFHLAAQPIVSEGYKDPFTTFNTNIMGTVITHELIRSLDKKVSLVNVTTDKVYEEGETPRIEGDILRGFDPYSLSKSCSDMITSCYSDCFDDKVISSTMRAGNVIGGGDYSANRIIPDAVRAAKNKTPLKLRHPESVRPYQHVFDALTAYLTIGMLQYEDSNYAGEYNVGPDHNSIASTEKVANVISNHLDIEIELGGESIGHENPMLLLDSTKLLEQTNWAPVYNSVESVLNETALWYNNVMNDEDALLTLQNQIKGGFVEYDNQ